MGFQFKQIGHSFHKLGNKITAGAHKLGNKILGGLRTAGEFIKDKALPAVEKVAGMVQGKIKSALPAIASISPQLTPLALGAIGVAGSVKKGAQFGQTLARGVERGIMDIRRPPMKQLM